MKSRVWILLLALIFSGCATKKPTVMPSKPDAPTPAQKKVRSVPLGTWQVKGRIAASQQGEGGNASFTWQQEPNFYKIRIFGPFGAGGAELTGSHKQVIFDDSEGQRRFAKTPETLVHQTTGIIMPVRGLKNWIQGVPSALYPVTVLEKNAQGQLTRLHQSGWQIHYDAYMPVGDLWMPKKMHLTRNGIKIKLILKQWQI